MKWGDVAACLRLQMLEDEKIEVKQKSNKTSLY